ncbi:MAG: class I SAM-dependent methyltransferase [Candidatus Parabeggiatoa sp.]|nr:class I SAM-dependent methyltransferase [Candidatus Parabeggiatoa sp.]
MSADYEHHSSSQKTIGQTVIESVVDVAKKEFGQFEELKVLDLACGPGNLTIELKQALKSAFPQTQIKLTGLDYTEENVNRLVNNSNGEIQGVVASFYDPFKLESQDIITSNEGLHWQPPSEMSEIIYSQLPPEERERYESWALNHFKKALKNIHNSLKKGGVAVLQFGHEGQLQNLWDLIRYTLCEAQFEGYKSKVNFPLYYPTEKNIEFLLSEVGFTNIKVDAFNQDLTEETSESITAFLAAFTKQGFSTFFKPDDLNDFYSRINAKLTRLKIDDFRKDQWHRTLIKATVAR